MTGNQVFWERKYAGAAGRLWGDEPSAVVAGIGNQLLASGTRWLLDLGCGSGRNAVWFAQQGLAVVGVDYSRAALASAQGLAQARGCNRVLFVHSDARALPFVDGAFDAVFCNAMLNYVWEGDALQVVAEVYRVLRPEGHCHLLAFSADDPACGLGQEVSQRTYTTDDLTCHFYTEDEIVQLFCNFSIEKLGTLLTVDSSHDEPHVHAVIVLHAMKRRDLHG